MFDWTHLVETTIGNRYRLLRIVDTHETSSVFLATDTDLSSEVRLIVFPNADEKQTTGLLEKLAGLSVPSLAQTRDTGVHDDIAFVVTEQPLGRTLDEFGQLSDIRMLMLAYDICGGLDDAYNQTGLCHGCLQPKRIVVAEEGTPEESFLLLDFGMNAFADVSLVPQSTFSSSHVCSCTEYLSPEQLRGEKPTRQSDVYSFGVILFELLTGKVPFPIGSSSIGDFVKRVQNDLPSRLSDTNLADEVNAIVESLVLRCLSKSPDGRPVLLKEIADILEEALDVERPSPIGAPPVSNDIAPLEARNLEADGCETMAGGVQLDAHVDKGQEDRQSPSPIPADPAVDVNREDDSPQSECERSPRLPRSSDSAEPAQGRETCWPGAKERGDHETGVPVPRNRPLGSRGDTFTPNGLPGQSEMIRPWEDTAQSGPSFAAHDTTRPNGFRNGDARCPRVAQTKGRLQTLTLLTASVGAIVFVGLMLAFFEKRELTTRVTQRVGNSDYQGAGEVVSSANWLARILLDETQLTNEIRQTGVAKLKELADQRQDREALQEYKKLSIVFFNHDETKEIIRDIADRIRSRVLGLADEKQYQQAIEYIDSEPVVRELSKLDDVFLDRLRLRNQVFEIGWQAATELGDKKSQQKAIDLLQELEPAFRDDADRSGQIRDKLVDLHVSLGQDDRNQTSFEEAVEEFRRALDLEPSRDRWLTITYERALAFRNWATFATDAEEAMPLFKKALEDLDTILKEKFNDSDAHVLRAQVHLERGKLRVEENPPFQAIQDFQEALQDVPGLSEADQQLQEIEDRFAEEGEYHFYKGQEATNLSQKEADRAFQSAIASLSVAILASHENEDGILEYYFFRGIARSELSRPNYRGAVEDLDRFQAGASKYLQRPDLAISDSIQERLGIGLSRLAWILATCAEDGVRNGEKSVRHAKDAAKILGSVYDNLGGQEREQNLISAFESLAVAYAETGEFERATEETTKLCVDFLSGSSEKEKEWEKQKNRIETFFKNKRPYRDPKSLAQTHIPAP